MVSQKDLCLVRGDARTGLQRKEGFAIQAGWSTLALAAMGIGMLCMAAVALNPGIINTEMLQDCFGKESASHYPDAAQWAKSAVPFLLKIGPKNNGQPLTVPGIPTD